ncbi:MAG TPA: hypothetical protein VN192_03925, partial [Flavobacterium sp.]|nr:hypothetical protein [Flavobacterium sp.]
MALLSINPTSTIAWQKLEKHFDTIKNNSMVEMFNNDPNRSSKFNIQWEDFLVDYSKNRISQETMNLLIELANEMNLNDAIAQYFNGDTINQTENRAVLHTALRAPSSQEIL